MKHPRHARLLVIAGSDSGGGAGIQADVKTATALRAYSMTAVTAVTAQDTRAVYSVHPIPASIVREQIAWTLDDIGADAIKTGMLGSVEIVETVAEVLAAKAKGIPLVVDPVLTSTSGTELLDNTALDILKVGLFSLATLVTPNTPEAEMLSGIPIRSDDDRVRAARALLATGCGAVLLKGGHNEGDTVTDLLVSKDGVERFSSPRIDTTHTHGTGCTLASAIAVGLGQGLSLSEAVSLGHQFVQHAILAAPGFGSGHGPLNHMHAILPHQR